MIWLLEALFGADAIGGPWSAGLRAALSLVLAFAVSIGFGRIFIAYQRRKQRLENTVRGDSKRLDALHLHKSSTPTMGGVIIFVASSLPSLLLVGSFGAPVLLLVGIGGALGAIGFADDWIKLRAPKKKASLRDGSSSRSSASVPLRAPLSCCCRSRCTNPADRVSSAKLSSFRGPRPGSSRSGSSSCRGWPSSSPRLRTPSTSRTVSMGLRQGAASSSPRP